MGLRDDLTRSLPPVPWGLSPIELLKWVTELFAVRSADLEIWRAADVAIEARFARACFPKRTDDAAIVSLETLPSYA